MALVVMEEIMGPAGHREEHAAVEIPGTGELPGMVIMAELVAQEQQVGQVSNGQ